MPWDSWDKEGKAAEYAKAEPSLWFHEIYRNNGKPYRPSEVKVFHQLTGVKVRAAAPTKLRSAKAPTARR